MSDSPRRLRVAIPAGSPFCEGHFPGRPIVPGVALVEIARRAMEDAGIPAAIRGFGALRFRSPVVPPADVEIIVDGARLGWRAGAETAASATLALEPSAPLGPPGIAAAPSRAPVAAGPLLPHQPPSRLIVSVSAAAEGSVTCEALVPAVSPFVVGGLAPSFLAVEIAAQAAAALEALERRRTDAGAGPPRGYLVGARGVALSRATLDADAPLVAVVRLAGAAPPLATYAFEVLEGTEVLARGGISTWLTPTDA